MSSLSRCCGGACPHEVTSGTPLCATICNPQIQRKQAHLENPVLSTSASRSHLIYLYFYTQPSVSSSFKAQEFVAFSRRCICWEVKIGFELRCNKVVSKNWDGSWEEILNVQHVEIIFIWLIILGWLHLMIWFFVCVCDSIQYKSALEFVPHNDSYWSRT